jgi:hypothetical protein
MTDVNKLKEVQRYCSQHREQVRNSALCGCFYCGVNFPSTEIDFWIGAPDGGLDNGENGTTALCPRCGIDSVLPDSILGAGLSPELLDEMRQYFFEREEPNTTMGLDLSAGLARPNDDT